MQISPNHINEIGNASIAKNYVCDISFYSKKMTAYIDIKIVVVLVFRIQRSLARNIIHFKYFKIVKIFHFPKERKKNIT